MRKAYDTFLQSQVSADSAAKERGFEPYRYKCAHCGEEVILAAAESKHMVPYFRHLSGNSDVECEFYLGQYGSISIDAQSRKSKNERAEFYFNIETKMFYLGICFSYDEIAAYEKLTTTFELRAETHKEPFYLLHINSINFDPDIQRMIPLEKFSYTYYLSNTLNNVKRPYEVFKKNGSNVPTFFKLQINDSKYKARLVRSPILYTDVPYFVAYQGQYRCPADSSLPSEIKVDSTFEFETMGRRFLGKILTIKSKTAQTDSLLMPWGYNLEASETLTLLWPPAAIADESVLINADYAYLYSTFELQSHGNINAHSEDIKRIANHVSKVTVNSRTKIYKKNTELVIDKRIQTKDNYDSLPLTKEVRCNFVVPDDGLYFLFNRSGVVPLRKGMSIFLTPESEIRHYVFGYLEGFIIPQEFPALPGEFLLKDILSHYKRMEAFIWDDFDSFELSQTAFQYIESCEKSGRINSAAKRFIEEGRI